MLTFSQKRAPPNQRPKTVIICALLLAINVGAWLWAWLAFAERPILLGTAALAYLIGLRHAFDADHIAAIDNVVRKLMQDGKEPQATGLFFALGHSTVVILVSIAVVLATATSWGGLASLDVIGSPIGASVSAGFLLLIGLANFLVLKNIWAVFISARRGEIVTDGKLAEASVPGGLLARVLKPILAGVARPWHMYPIGILFGLSFDTATEIGLLAISATQAAKGLSFWSLLVFPALFTAGMSLLDTLDSMLMTRVYGWALISPTRKLWYNLVITTASVLVALFIGGLGTLGLLADQLGQSGSLWAVSDQLNGSLTNFGWAVAGIFIASWAFSVWLAAAGSSQNVEEALLKEEGGAVSSVRSRG
jgi:nickel/cobalt transporter (NiCoT) family protein